MYNYDLFVLLYDKNLHNVAKKIKYILFNII